MDSTISILMMASASLSVITLISGIILLARSTIHDRRIKQRLHRAHTDFLLESLKNKRD